MEYLDIYDENENYLGKEKRSIVHQNALWHKTVHCWLYDKKGNVYFQLRKDEGTLYTTASGHVDAGETIKEAFGREVLEEIGVNVDYESANLVEINKFVMDKLKEDGTYFKDRAFANVYVCEYKGSSEDFNLNLDELKGIVKVNVNDALDLFNHKKDVINGVLLRVVENQNVLEKKDFKIQDFLVNSGETAIGKYGNVLRKIIELI
ncbi:MAG: NUDIX domain-containing protein [Mollicutes bacterium]|nr:NUDIX domain-containing protein [Mollicutes bacterium]